MGWNDKDVEFSSLKDKTLLSISRHNDELFFGTTTGEHYKMYHSQDCCEHVYVEDICGDIGDIVGSPILLAEEVSSNEPSKEIKEERKADYDKRKKEDGKDFYDSDYGPNPRNNWSEESETWTFYKLSTIKGSVTIRWYGSSNGYYSESVNFVEAE